MLSCSIWSCVRWGWCSAPSAPYTRPTQRLSRPPPIQKLGAENHMLQLNIQCSWWWAYVPETCRAKNTSIKLPCCIKLAFHIITRVTRICCNDISIQLTHKFYTVLTCTHFRTNGCPEDNRNKIETSCHAMVWQSNINISKVLLTVRSTMYFRLHRGSNPDSLAVQDVAQSPYRLGFISTNSMRSHHYIYIYLSYH